MQTTDNNELMLHLSDLGYTDSEIAKIIREVVKYDTNTAHDSILDSFETGTFSLQTIIDDALATDDPAKAPDPTPVRRSLTFHALETPR